MNVVTLTKERLEELKYVRKEKNGTIYYQNGDALVIYRDTGIWEFAYDEINPTADKCYIYSEDDLKFYLRKR